MENLQLETLLKIFSYLSEKDVVLCCSTVNKLWKTAAAMTIECIYKRKCIKDHPEIYKEAHRTSGLSFRELYNSLNLWPKISEVNIKVNECWLLEENSYLEIFRIDRFRDGMTDNQYLQFLKNGVVSYPCNCVERNDDDDYDEDIEPRQGGDFDTISYYDTNTVTVINSEVFDFRFQYYEETDDIIVISDENSTLFIIIKSNKKRFNVGTMRSNSWTDKHNFVLFRNNVYFQTPDYFIWEAKLVQTNDSATIEGKRIFELKHYIVSINIGAENQLNILSKSLDCRIHISVWDRTELRYKTEVDKSKPVNTVINLLKQYGFEWHERRTYEVLTERGVNGDKFDVTHAKDSMLVSHGKTILICTSRCLLKVYPNVYRKGLLSNLKSKKPAEKFHLTDSFSLDYMESLSSAVRQILVTEIKNGHRIIILRREKMVVLDLTH